VTTNTVIEQSQLRGSPDDDLLQRVATVYVDGEEYRVLAPSRAIGDSLEWVNQFHVHRPDKESFNSEVVVEGAYRILALKLVKQELEKRKSSSNSSVRQETRKAKLHELLSELANLRLCGPSDDPDEQTSAIESYRYLLINVKALCRGVLPDDVCAQLDAVPNEIETIYDVYESKAHLDAACVDIGIELDYPTSSSSSQITMKTGSPTSIEPEVQSLENWHLRNMAAEIPTLKDLKALSVPKQAQLLLRRLATQYPNSGSSVGKMNLDMPVYASDLASGYPLIEVNAVKDLLLGAAWKRLEADGFIRDNGHNFFHVTEEGYEAAKKADTFFVNREVVEALRLLHPDFQGYAHCFYEDKLPEAIAAAFERYENRLNEIRDGSKISLVMASAGHPLVYKLFEAKILKEPYPALGNNPTAKAAYEKGLTGILSGGVSWLRNARTHEKHNLPVPTAQETLELLFVASYLMRMLDLSHR
jgi:hypothetical protein